MDRKPPRDVAAATIALLMAASVFAGEPSHSTPRRTTGIDHRVPWTTSRSSAALIPLPLISSRSPFRG